MITARDITVRIGEKVVLDRASITAGSGELVVVAGKNGSGKSTLLSVLAGTATGEGEVLLDDADITAVPLHERARKGIYMTFQQPVPLPGVTHARFLMAALKERGSELSPEEMLVKFRGLLDVVGLPQETLTREVHVGASGGERKKAELWHMLVLEPKVLLLDELDSGLDADAVLRTREIVAGLKQEGRAVVVVTHSPLLMRGLPIDRVYVLDGGKVVEAGGKEVAERIADYGFGDGV